MKAIAEKGRRVVGRKGKPRTGKESKRKLGRRSLLRETRELDRQSLVGSVFETDAEHSRRHPAAESKWAKKCVRCAFMKRKIALLSYARSGQVSWLVPRPVSMGGFWALGCCLCAATLASPEFRSAHAAAVSGPRLGSRSSKWAQYGIRRISAGSLSNHGATLSHKEAVRSVSESDFHLRLAPKLAAFGAIEQRAELEADLQLTKGRVPQPSDWADAWAEATSQMSWLKQERLDTKKQGKNAKCKRQQRTKMCYIMAEVVRIKHRKAIREATSLTLTTDDAKGRKVLRFRCDTPTEPYQGDGLIGIAGKTLKTSAEGPRAIEADHAESTVASIEQALRSFCTPLGGDCDEALFKHLCGIVHFLASDGARSERKALFLAAKKLFPNAIYLIRDAAHAIRIACKVPLHCDDVFAQIWEEIANKKHALLPDIQNSEKLKAWLAHIQHTQASCVRLPGDLRPLDKVLKHFSFAKQRFESYADPMAKVAVLLLPVCTLLSFISCDERHGKEQRQRAVDTLKLFTPKFCIGLGMSADFALVCTEFLRLFDCLNHDMANSVTEAEQFLETLQAMFRKGFVFGITVPGQPLAAGSSDAAAPAQPGRVKLFFCLRRTNK